MHIHLCVHRDGEEREREDREGERERQERKRKIIVYKCQRKHAIYAEVRPRSLAQWESYLPSTHRYWVLASAPKSNACVHLCICLCVKECVCTYSCVDAHPCVCVCTRACECMCVCVKNWLQRRKYYPWWDGGSVTMEESILQGVITALNLCTCLSVPVRKVPEPLEYITSLGRWSALFEEAHTCVSCAHLPGGFKCSFSGFPSLTQHRGWISSSRATDERSSGRAGNVCAYSVQVNCFPFVVVWICGYGAWRYGGPTV